MNPGKWRILITRKSNAAFNMALDEILLERLARGNSVSTIRLYSWSPPAISVGYSHDPLRLLFLDRCRRDGLCVVHRITGGRAVLHDGEVTYSVIGLKNGPLFGGSLHDTYRKISGVLSSSLRRLGVGAELSEGSQLQKTGLWTALPVKPAGIPCFLSVSRWEITVDSKKIVGSAQRRRKGVFLQHGSILLNESHKRIVNYLRTGDRPEEVEDITRIFQEELDRRTTSASKVLHRPVTFDNMTEAILKEFQSIIPQLLVTEEITEGEHVDLSNCLAVKEPILEGVSVS